MFDPSIPIDPTQPRDPVLVPRRRPAPVTLAALFMVVGAALGLISAIMLIAASGSIAAGFRSSARGIDAKPEDIDTITAAIRTVFVAAGVVSLTLAVGLGVLSVGVARGRSAARVATLGFVARVAVLWAWLHLLHGAGPGRYLDSGR